jgi:hypothetical protein
MDSIDREWQEWQKRAAQRLVYCGKIDSHPWYRGRWVTDTCACGHKFRVPAGSKGKYRCNCCANLQYGP